MEKLVPREPGVPGKISLYVVLALSVLAAVIVVLYIYVFILGGTFLSPSSPLSELFEPLYVQPNPDGTVSWYDNEKGEIVSHLAPEPGQLTGITRSGDTVYLSLERPGVRAGSDLYRYQNGAYQKVYSEPVNVVGNLSTSPNGTYIGFADTNGASSTATMLNPSTGAVTPLGTSTLAPEFLASGTTVVVIYADGVNLAARVLTNGTWSAPQELYTGTVSTMKNFATDGYLSFAFVDPNNATLEIWKVTSFTPLVVSPVSLDSHYIGYQLIYGKDQLFGYQSLRDSAFTHQHIILHTLTGTETYSYLPLQATNPLALVFLTPIPSSP